jgi:glycosyltransferase involved in cell wall biosynthesis
VVSDNDAIAEYVEQTSHVITYGRDHALAVGAASLDEYDLPDEYAFSVCRIEPENNIHMVVEAFAKLPSKALVMVGNWNNSEYGRDIRLRYSDRHNLYLLDAVYDLAKLNTLRQQASFYVHGHSAGGTNPSLVEAMHFGKAVLAFDCDYNRSTTENKALFFNNAQELMRLIASFNKEVATRVGLEMLEIAQRRYTWNIVAKQYFALLKG